MAALGGDNTTSSGNESGADGVAAAALLLPDAVSQKSYALLVEYAARLELTLSDTAASRTVRGTLTELLAHEGTRWWELQMGQAVMNSAAAANEARFLALVSQLVFGKAETGGSGSATAEAQSEAQLIVLQSKIDSLNAAEASGGEAALGDGSSRSSASCSCGIMPPGTQYESDGSHAPRSPGANGSGGSANQVPKAPRNLRSLNFPMRRIM